MIRTRAQYRAHHPLTAVAALALTLTVGGLAACGSSDDATTDLTTGATVTATADATVAAATEADPSTTEPATGDSSDDYTDDSAATDDTDGPVEGATTVIKATVAGGKVTVDAARFDVALGSEVSIVVETDVAEPVHLHGYDIETEAAPGAPARIDFTADVPGVFEVELEDSGTLLFEIEVS